MTTNLAESVNLVLKGVWFLPIIGLVQAKIYRLMEWFKKHRTMYEAKKKARKKLSEKVTTTIPTNSQCATRYHVIGINRQSSLFKVKELNDLINH